LSARYDCFARELRDYCEYRLACPIVLDTRKNGRRSGSFAIFAAIRRGLSLVSSLAAERRPGDRSGAGL
jgi:hypothetical protein